MNKAVKRMTLTALLAALTFVTTAFIHIPLPVGTGYFNLGDSVILFSAIFVDPFAGALVGIIGASFADIYVGAIEFVPFTIVAKLLEAVIAGYLFRTFKGKWSYTALYIGAFFIVPVYAISYFIFFGGWSGVIANSPFDLLQAFVSAIIATVLIVTLRKTKIRSLSDE